MVAPRSTQSRLLEPIDNLLDEIANRSTKQSLREARFQILEAAAAEIGGATREFIYEKSAVDSPGTVRDSLLRALVREISALPMPPAVALSALAQPSVDHARRRTTGAYHTDFRLAAYVARYVGAGQTGLTLDPACGSGILLAALASRIAREDRSSLARYLADAACGSDLCEDALRGARLALFSLSSDLGVLERLAARLRLIDSLRAGRHAWKDVAPGGFAVVIANPPWEKLKISRHELLRAHGHDRHYGDVYEAECVGLESAKARLADYVSGLDSAFTLQGRGEADLYKLFSELALRLLAPGGQMGLILPAGLIRSQGTEELRRSLIDACGQLDLTVFENRARFFPIDTRFKFVTLHGERLNGKPKKPVYVNWTEATDDAIERTSRVRVARGVLARLRPDLSVPEVRSQAEWDLFRSLADGRPQFGDPGGVWQPGFCREVDMTRERTLFAPERGAGLLPLIEGRMVHQYCYAAKRHVSGTGRRAVWRADEDESAQLHPQFFFPAESLPKSVRVRVGRWRVGFCDITGQTNERTMLASRIPPHTVCGNKVPTIVFQNSRHQRLWGDCWLAIVNSFLFDWLMRRVVTTTVNYFLLNDMPMPSLSPSSDVGRKLAALAARIQGARLPHGWAAAELRAEIEWRVAGAYEQTADTLGLVLHDFPLLDRAQPPLPGDDASTVTADLVRLRATEALGPYDRSLVARLRDRIAGARAIGAVPFVPSHLASSGS